MLVDLSALVQAFAGGLMIGFATLVLFLFLGRIAGNSGIVGNALDFSGDGPQRFWRLAYLLGLVIAPMVAVGFKLGRLAPPSENNVMVLVVAGLLVGYGTRLGDGCTSGHAVCGLARFSRRSLVATVIFMTTAMVVIFCRRHLWGI